MKSLILSTAVLSAVALYAGSKDAQSCVEPLKQPITLYESFDNRGCGFGFSGDVLYMNYTMPTVAYGAARATADAVLESHVLPTPAQAKLGWNVALYYTMPDTPGYSFESNWFHIRTKRTGSDTANVILAHSIAVTTATQGTLSNHGHLMINFVDLLMSKMFSFGDWVAIAPSAGLVGGYMHSKNRATAAASSGSFSATSALHNATLSQSLKFKGIGLKIGAKADVTIWNGLKFISNLYYNALYGMTKAHMSYTQDALFSVWTGADAHTTQHHGRSFLDALLGLSWGGAFCKNTMYLEAHAGWRTQSFFDGWWLYEAEFDDSLSAHTLFGQGLQAGATFKF